MREFLEPVLIKVMEAITPETLSDWSMCMSEISVSETENVNLIVMTSSLIWISVSCVEFENCTVFLIYEREKFLLNKYGYSVLPISLSGISKLTGFCGEPQYFWAFACSFSAGQSGSSPALLDCRTLH